MLDYFFGYWSTKKSGPSRSELETRKAQLKLQIEEIENQLETLDFVIPEAPPPPPSFSEEGGITIIETSIRKSKSQPLPQVTNSLVSEFSQYFLQGSDVRATLRGRKKNYRVASLPFKREEKIGFMAVMDDIQKGNYSLRETPPN